MLPAFLHQSADWPVREIVIVDGDSQDQTQTLLRIWKDTPVGDAAPVRKCLSANKGRGNQMNAGAKIATGDLLLFLHADSILPESHISWFDEIAKALDDPRVVGGAFRLKIDSPSLILKSISMTANLRSALLGLPYGDQGIFVRTDIFRKMEGFKDWPLMEDVELIQRLKRLGKIVLLKETIQTSVRRWKRGGVVVSFRNVILLLLYFMGVCPRRLARWYN